MLSVRACTQTKDGWQCSERFVPAFPQPEHNRPRKMYMFLRSMEIDKLTPNHRALKCFPSLLSAHPPHSSSTSSRSKKPFWLSRWLAKQKTTRESIRQAERGFHPWGLGREDGTPLEEFGRGADGVYYLGRETGMGHDLGTGVVYDEDARSVEPRDWIDLDVKASPSSSLAA